MPAIIIQITRYTDDRNPGWVECRLIDASGNEWLFEEKVPVVSIEELDAASDFPQAGSIECTIIDRNSGEQGQSLIKVDTSKPWGVQTINGVTTFIVHEDQLIE